MRVWLSALAVLLLTLPAAAAQVPAGASEFQFGRDEDAGEYVITLDGTGSYTTGAWGNGALYTTEGRDWAFRLIDFPATDIAFDSTGTIEVSLEVGGSGDTEAGIADVGWELTYAGEELATGDEQEIMYNGGQEVVTWSVAAPDGTYDVVSGDLVFRVYTTGHIGQGARMDLEPSSLSMPLLATGPPPGGEEAAPVVENLTEAAAERTVQGNESVQFRFPGSLEDGSLWLQTAGEGNLSFELIDAANATLIEGTMTGSGNETFGFEGAATGEWVLSVSFEEFVGDFGFSVQAPSAGATPGQGDPDNSGPGAGDGGDGDVDGNETVDGGSGGADKESPGLFVPAVLLALVMALRRRDG